MSRNGKTGTPGLLLSPNSVLANALLRSIDLLRPRVLAARPSRVDALVWLAARPATLPVRAHEMGIYKRYFDLIATGRKTTEIRVNDSSRKKIREGSLIRFRCQGDEVLTRVTKVARYASFEEMFNHESVASVNPLATREQQLANIRQIYPPEREALGVVAIGIELVEWSQR